MMNLFSRFLRLGAIIGPLPNTLTNGTIADANQVMGDLNWIVSQVNANASAGAGTVTRNILLNGAMEISQRFVTTSQNIAGTKAYTVDRWQGSSGAASSGDFVQLSSIGLNQYQYALRAQRTAGNTATTTIQVAQSLETADSYQMQGQTVTLSFYARAGANYSAASNALVATLYTGTGTDQNVLTGYTGSAASVTQTLNLTNSWARYSVTGTIPTTATEVGVVFTMTPVGTAGAADYFDLTGVQLELSPSASSFDFRAFVETYYRCQRYYQKTFGYPTVPAQNTSNGNYLSTPATRAGAVNNVGPYTFYQVPMRQTPTATTFNPYAANAQARNVTQSADFSVTNLNAGIIAVRITGTTPVATAVGDELAVHFTLDAEL
jgi:hypothetical protein